MKEKPYTIASGAMQTGQCVLKITYDGKKYIIAKGKEGYATAKRIENSLNAFIRGGHNDPTGVYFHFFNYIKKNPHKDFKVEVLLESDSAYELLKLEQIELDKGKKDRKFMNNQVNAYIPEWKEDKQMYGNWIPGHAVMNYRNWFKKRPKPGR